MRQNLLINISMIYTHHDNERVAVEELAVQVRDETDRGATDGCGDVVLVRELGAGEVIAHPANARNGNE